MSEVPWYLQYIKEILGSIAAIVAAVVYLVKRKSKKPQITMQQTVSSKTETEVNVNVPISIGESRKEIAETKKEEIEKDKRWDINERIHLDKKSYKDYELKKGSSISVEISSDNPVDIFILDEENFDRFKRGLKKVEPRLFKEGVSKTTFNDKMPKSFKCYLIIVNGGRTPVIVDVKFRYEWNYQGYYETTKDGLQERGDNMRYKIQISAPKEKTKREYTIEASNNEEFKRELSRISKKWIDETGILNFTLTSITTG